MWFEMPGLTTIETVGSKEIPHPTTGHEKNRNKVSLAAKACDTKLKPFVFI